MRLRPARLEDAEAIRLIYNVEVETSTVTFDMVPRTLEDQQRWIQERSGVHLALVAVDDEGSVAGFGSLSPYRDRPAYSPTVEDSVYVARNRQGEGVGKLLLQGLVEAAQAQGFHSVMARVVGGHDASIRLHAAAGFEVVGTEREVGRKHRRWLDVVLMQRLL
jgi:phosphinothricin acetyltransferase